MSAERSGYPHEERWIELPKVEGVVRLLMQTMRGETLRDISCRRARRGKASSIYHGQNYRYTCEDYKAAYRSKNRRHPPPSNVATLLTMLSGLGPPCHAQLVQQRLRFY
jgi:hypothetical protein